LRYGPRNRKVALEKLWAAARSSLKTSTLARFPGVPNLNSTYKSKWISKKLVFEEFLTSKNFALKKKRADFRDCKTERLENCSAGRIQVELPVMQDTTKNVRTLETLETRDTIKVSLVRTNRRQNGEH